jgi:hypothetical protein
VVRTDIVEPGSLSSITPGISRGRAAGDPGNGVPPPGAGAELGDSVDGGSFMV